MVQVITILCQGVNGNGFTLVGESGQASAMSHRLKVTASLFDMLSDNSSVDHPLCEECTDTLLQCLEQQLEQAEQDSQQYQVTTHSILELETKVIRRFPKISQSQRRPLLGPSPD